MRQTKRLFLVTWPNGRCSEQSSATACARNMVVGDVPVKGTIFLSRIQFVEARAVEGLTIQRTEYALQLRQKSGIKRYCFWTD
jgi:hypothetical protein